MKICLYAVRCKKGWEVRVSLDFAVDLEWWTQEGQRAGDWSSTGRNSLYGRVMKKAEVYERSRVPVEHETDERKAEILLLLADELPLGLAIGLRDEFVHEDVMDDWGPKEWKKYVQAECAGQLKKNGNGDQFFLQELNPMQLIWTRLSGMTPEGRAVEKELRAKQARAGELVTEQVASMGTLDMQVLNVELADREEMNTQVKGIEAMSSSTLNTGAMNMQLVDSDVINKQLLNMEEMNKQILDKQVLDAEVLNQQILGTKAIAHGASRLGDALMGRSLLAAELQQLLAERLPELAPAWRSAAQYAHLQGRVQLTAGVASATARHNRALLRSRARPPRCLRCGSEAPRRTPCGSCGLSSCAYCEACLALGRSRSCALLLRGSAGVVPQPGGGTARAAPTESLLDRWGLSPAQRAAAGEALRFLAQPQEAGARGGGRRAKPSGSAARLHDGCRTTTRAAAQMAIPRFLLWAVTGAGKTEMIFPLIQYVLDQGGTVLVATPRRDVVLELAPRIAAAFPDEPAAVLYGGSTQRWERARLYLATTHQLLRFHQAFDLVIIDELDAFPYHNDPMLAFAAEASCKPEGCFIYLSATPPLALQREIRQGKLPHAKVPARFHGYPLPVPRRVAMSSVAEALGHQRLPGSLLQPLNESIQRGAQIFMFVSRIRHIDPFVALLRRKFSTLPIAGTSSQDEERSNKVLAFRAGEIRILVTTTILERGVTVPKSDVYILDADSALFDEASLVQMSGRAGRSKDDPAGVVIFASPEWTASQRAAVKQIKSMNKIALKKGFLRNENRN
ncbi:DEAD/DEAH box helicase [Paenibacillus lentus]|uniref:DEAD/DEAH box helicase n=1 Tax=Paenibacillus lentus TaxID=1338368 RepID=UPI003667440B